MGLKRKNLNLPKFDDSPPTSNTKAIKPDGLATGPTKNREPVQKHIKSELGDDWEEGEIKEEIEDEAGVLPDIGQPGPRQEGSSYEPGFGGCPPGSLPQSMPQSSVSHPGHPRVYLHSQPISTLFYAVILYYGIDLPPSRPDDLFRGGDDPKVLYRASYSQLHAFPPRLEDSTPPGIRPSALRPCKNSGCNIVNIICLL